MVMLFYYKKDILYLIVIYFSIHTFYFFLVNKIKEYALPSFKLESIIIIVEFVCKQKIGLLCRSMEPFLLKKGHF